MKIQQNIQYTRKVSSINYVDICLYAHNKEFQK